MSEYNTKNYNETDLIKQAEKTAEETINILKNLSSDAAFLNTGKSPSIALAESCTAGMVSSLLAGIPGASGFLWGSFVCYTKEAKISMLDLDKKDLETYSLVSRETAGVMACAAMEKSGACFSAAVTGLAGPEGDGSDVPVGTVWIATLMYNGKSRINKYHFKGSRNSIRIRAAITVLEELIMAINEQLIYIKNTKK